MSKQTIKAQIEEIEQFIITEGHEAIEDSHKQQLDALSQRRLTIQQRELVEAIQEQIEEWDEAEKEAGYTMSNQLKKYRARYHRSVAASGAKSLNNGDDLAEYLQMKTGKEVCELADEFTPIKGGQTHFERYARLNEGQKRMNSGNKLRAAVKNGLIEVTETGIQSV